MASFAQTRDLERSLIKLLSGSKMMARLHMSKVKTEWFTSPERKFIADCMREVMSSNNAALSKNVFEYMVGSQVPDSERSSYISEWNFIEALTTNEDVEVLMGKMEEARVGQEALGTLEEVAELLEEGRVPEAISALKMKAVTIGGTVEDRPLVEITDYQRRLQLIKDKQANPDKYKGIKIGFETFDNNAGGVFINELLLIAGITGLGKSTLVKQICTNIIRLNKDINVLHIANEEHQEQVESKYDANLSGIHYSNFKRADITDEEVEKWTDGMDRLKDRSKRGESGRIFVKEVAAFTDATLIEQAYRELEQRGIKIHVIVIDHLPHLKPIQQAWGENDERAKAASDCKELARSLHTAVIVPTQAATDVEEKQNKGRRAGKLDVYGSKGQIHVANTFLIITSKGQDMGQELGKDIDEDWERDVFWLCDIKKQRDGAPFWFFAKHFVKNGRVVEIKEEMMSQPKGKDVNKAITEAVGDGSEDEEKPEGEKQEIDAQVARECDEALLEEPEAPSEPDKNDKADNVPSEPVKASEDNSGASEGDSKMTARMAKMKAAARILAKKSAQ